MIHCTEDSKVPSSQIDLRTTIINSLECMLDDSIYPTIYNGLLDTLEPLDRLINTSIWRNKRNLIKTS